MNFKPLKNHMEVSTMDEVVLWEHTGKTADDMPIEEPQMEMEEEQPQPMGLMARRQ